MNETKKVEKKGEKRKKKEMIILLSLSFTLDLFSHLPLSFCVARRTIFKPIIFCFKEWWEGGFFLLSELRKWGFPVKIGW